MSRFTDTLILSIKKLSIIEIILGKICRQVSLIFYRCQLIGKKTRLGKKIYY